MTSKQLKSGQHQSRIELIARVQFAYEQVRDLMSRPSRSARTQASIAHARERLQLLNRALAMMALQSAGAAA